MNQLKCPKCGAAFTVDESDYALILQQVQDTEIQRQVDEKLEIALKQNDADHEIKLQNSISDKEKKITELKSKLQTLKVQAKADAEKELSKKEREFLKQQNEAEKEIAKLQGNIANSEEKHKNKILVAQENYEQQLKNQKSNYEQKLQVCEEEIQRLKDFRKGLSTKMLGETLEKHCEDVFNQLRSTAFQTAYFEKDNDTKEGTKGDYIFRDFVDDVELVSIMFEMKNEDDETATKHKNEDFFDKLDKDRKKKKCEYAILVSMLEQDSDLYNQGIVDVSYKYPKMYVIRPQFFIPIITLIRNAARKNMEDKIALVRMQKENIDVTNFENSMEEFKEKFGANYKRAADKFEAAIADIDKTIKSLEKTKKDLMSSENQLRLANNKAQDLSIKKLTRKNPTMKQKFEELKK